MVASIVQAVRQCIAAKNANAANASATAGLYGFALNDSRRSLWEVVEAVLEADEEIVTAILETVGHWARPDYLADSVTIAHGTEIPTHTGEIGKVLIQRSNGASWRAPRGRKPAAEIERIRDNTGVFPNNVYGATAHTDAGSPLSGLYDISEEDLLFYTGYSAKVQLASFARALKTITDASINTGVDPKLLTSTSISGSSDAGSIVVVTGGGLAGVDFAAEIKAASVGTATLVEAASTTVTNVTTWIARCQSPASYLGGIVNLALPRLFKEGDDANLQAIAEKRADEVIPAVKRNARLMPDVVQGEMAA